jgi:hypothetical protein
MAVGQTWGGLSHCTFLQVKVLKAGLVAYYVLITVLVLLGGKLFPRLKF